MEDYKKKSRHRHCGKPMQRVYIRKGTDKRKWIPIGYYCEHCNTMLGDVDFVTQQGLLKNIGDDVRLVDRITNPKSIVIDLGAALTKVGFAGENQPRFIIESAVFYSISGEMFIQENNFINKNMQIKRKVSIFNDTEILENIVNTEQIEIFFNLVFKKLKVKPSEMSILILERPQKDTYVDALFGRQEAIDECGLQENAKKVLRKKELQENLPVYTNTRIIRRKIATVLFDKFSIPKLYCTIKEVVALYADGNTTGTVVNIGSTATRIVPIYEGWIITHSINIRNKGGKNVIQCMQEFTNNNLQNIKVTKENEYLIMRNIQIATEDFCYIAKNPKEEKNIWKNSDRKIRSVNILKDNFVKFDEILYEAPEVLFGKEPLSVTKEPGDLIDAIIESIRKCNTKLAKKLYSRIVLIGGGTLYQGFKDRFASEIKKKLPETLFVNVEADEDRLIKGWRGGSVLISLKIFKEKELWVTKKEFEEKGSSAVDRCI